MIMNFDNPHQVEEVLEKQIEDLHHDSMHGAHALQKMADGLPALGIVAAVLGVIKTMASIDKPPEVLGQMIGGALVGTFLGVFLAYGIVGPFADKVKAINEEEQQFYALIRESLVASLNKHTPQICVEVARRSAPKKLRPTFNDMEEALREVQKAA
ncbi:MAG: MotA/TolQ/ExbB proton channel family protein, partial [Hyphococcus sp.]